MGFHNRRRPSQQRPPARGHLPTSSLCRSPRSDAESRSPAEDVVDFRRCKAWGEKFNFTEQNWNLYRLSLIYTGNIWDIIPLGGTFWRIYRQSHIDTWVSTFIKPFIHLGRGKYLMHHAINGVFLPRSPFPSCFLWPGFVPQRRHPEHCHLRVCVCV